MPPLQSSQLCRHLRLHCLPFEEHIHTSYTYIQPLTAPQLESRLHPTSYHPYGLPLPSLTACGGVWPW